MRYKAMFAAGLVTGYVFGAKAGRERYETIRRASRRIVENPSVQEAAGVLQAQASDYAGAARKKLDDKVGDRVPASVRTRMSGPEPKPTADGQQRA